MTRVPAGGVVVEFRAGPIAWGHRNMASWTIAATANEPNTGQR